MLLSVSCFLLVSGHCFFLLLIGIPFISPLQFNVTCLLYLSLSLPCLHQFVVFLLCFQINVFAARFLLIPYCVGYCSFFLLMGMPSTSLLQINVTVCHSLSSFLVALVSCLPHAIQIYIFATLCSLLIASVHFFYSLACAIINCNAFAAHTCFYLLCFCIDYCLQSVQNLQYHSAKVCIFRQYLLYTNSCQFMKLAQRQTFFI